MPTTTQNFNGVTPPALPAGYSLSPASGNGIITTATGARSGNCITQSAPDSANLGFPNYFMDNTALDNTASVVVDAYLSATAGVSMHWVARANSPTDPQTCYLGLINIETAPYNFQIYKRVAGTYTLIGTQTGAAGTGEGLASLEPGYARIVLTVTGITITMEAQRPSDGFWVKPDGSAQSTRIAALTVTDSSIPATGTGYAGLAWKKATSSTSVLALMDDLSITATPAGGATTFAISAPVERRSEFVGNRSFACHVTPNGTGSDTLTLSDGGGGGTFQNSAGTTITTLVWAGDGATKVFYYTPGSAGAKTISGTVPSKTVTGSFVFTAVATRAARDFYISATGSDSNTGTIGSPLQTTAGMMALPYRPGDRRYFAAGGTFAPFEMYDSGTSGSPIITSSYGTANNGLAIIDSGDVGAVKATNVAWNAVDLLKLLGSGYDATTGASTNGGATVPGSVIRENGFGVVFTSNTATGTPYRGNKVTRCDISGFYIGVTFRSEHSDPNTTPDAFDGFQITQNHIHHCLEFGVYPFGGKGVNKSGSPFNFYSDFLHTNWYIADNHIHHIPGDPINNVGGGVGTQCNNGKNGLNERNYVHHCATWVGRDTTVGGGGGAEVLLACEDCVIQDSHAHSNSTPIRIDACDYDIDGGCNRCIVQRCYGGRTYGPPGMHGVYPGSQPTTKCIFRWNLFIAGGQNPQILKEDGQIPQSLTNDFGDGAGECLYYGNTYIVKASPAPLQPFAFSYNGANANIRAYNNLIIIADAGNGFVRDTGGDFIANGNRYYALTGVPLTNAWKYNGTDYSTFASYKTGSGQDTASTYGDPMLRDVNWEEILEIGTPVSSIDAFDAQSGGALALAGINLAALGLSGYPALNGTDIRGNTRAATSLQVGPSATLYVPGGGAGTITAVSVAPTSKTLYPEGAIRLVPTVTGTGGFDDSVVWAKVTSGNPITLYDLPDGSVIVQANTGAAAGSYQVRATSAQDGTKTATATITVQAVPAGGGGGLSDEQDALLRDVWAKMRGNSARTDTGDTYKGPDGEDRFKVSFPATNVRTSEDL